MSMTPDSLTPREGKVLRFVVMSGYVPDVRYTQIPPSHVIVTDMPRTGIQARYVLWKLVKFGLVRRKLIGHVATESGQRLLKEADRRKLWLA